MKSYKLLLALLLTMALLFAGCAKTEEVAQETPATDAVVEETVEEATEEAVEEEPAVELEDGFVAATIEVEDYGTIKLVLDGNEAPISVANFVSLVESGFYDGLTFHRIISDFMIQGGCPDGTGMGGSDETIKGEFTANGVENSISHVRGTISMARSSAMDSASSQFFIVHQDSTFLDGQYAGFGTVVEGMEVVDAICANTPVTDGNGSVSAENQPVITSITID